MTRHSALLRVLVAVAAFGLLAAACGDDDTTDDTTEPTVEAPTSDPVAITDPWSRQPAEGQTATAVYGVVSNPTATDVRIVSASSSVTEVVELHETLMDDEGVMSMQEVEEGFVVPAGGEFAFEPGGPHIMLLDIDAATYPTSVDITLELDSGDQLAFSAEVREVEGDMSMDDSEMEMETEMEGSG